MISLLQDPKLNAIWAKIPELADATNIALLGGGLTNVNYRVDTPTGTFVMRVSDTPPGLLGINRENERINSDRAYQAGVGAAVINYLPVENVLVISWINAKTLCPADIHLQPSLLPRIATSLKMLHKGPQFQGVFHFPTIRKKYLKTVLDAGYFIPDQYLNLETLVRQLEEEISSNPEDLVPCNNDLLAENFMDDGKKIWIIDYEYAGQNEASFEIGNFAGEVSLSDEQLANFCDAYWQIHSPKKIARAMAWSIIARFGWVMWASIQESASTIDFDFRAWGIKKWNSVLPDIQGSRYQEVLKNLKKYNS